jgi:hypothetical protein
LLLGTDIDDVESLMQFFLAERWRPQIGDPNPTAWVITVGYFVVCGMCFWAGWKERENQGRANEKLMPVFWFVLCGLLFFLGWNKQLDLQTLFTQIGRDAAKEGGWYEDRRPIQAVFVVIFALLGAGAVGAGIYFMRDVWKRYRVAYMGIIYLGVFVVIRAASFHHIDTVLYHLPGIKYWVNTILELGGIGIVGYAAYVAAMQKYGVKYQAFETRVRIR